MEAAPAGLPLLGAWRAACSNLLDGSVNDGRYLSVYFLRTHLFTLTEPFFQVAIQIDSMHLSTPLPLILMETFGIP